jgi:hypothetical protein
VRIALPITRIPGRVVFWAAAGMALLVSHDAIYLVQVGPGAELASTLRSAAHDYWGLASLALILVGLVAAIGSALHLRGLRRTADAVGAEGSALRTRPYLRRWLAAWARLAAVVAIGFALQENVEHVLRHGHAPGLEALIGPEFPLALPVIGLITAVAALVVAALGQVERSLLAAIADAVRRAHRRAPRSVARPPLRLPAVAGSPLARAAAGRAPPLRVAFVH